MERKNVIATVFYREVYNPSLSLSTCSHSLAHTNGMILGVLQTLGIQTRRITCDRGCTPCVDSPAPPYLFIPIVLQIISDGPRVVGGRLHEVGAGFIAMATETTQASPHNSQQSLPDSCCEDAKQESIR